MATVATLIFEMSANVARLQQDMSKAQAHVKLATDAIQSAIATTKTAFEMLGVGLSAHAFVSFIESGIAAEASLHRLSLQTGVAVETLSALRPVAKAAGTDLDTTATLVNRLEKNMLTFSQTGKGLMAPAFEQLGYSQAQVAAGLRDIDSFLPEFARRLVAAGVGGEKAGLAMQLMGRGGAQALPFLVELANQAKLVGTETTAGAEGAHEFEVSMAKLKERSTLLSISLANELLPGLNRFTEGLIRARKESGLLASVWAGLREAYGGTELDKANRTLYEQTNKLMALEQQLAKADKDDPRNENLRKHIALLKDDLAATRARWELLSHEQSVKDKAAEKPANKPLPDISGSKGAHGRSGLSEHELQVYEMSVKSVKELDAAEKERNKNLDTQAKQFDAATKEWEHWTDAQNKLLDQQAQHWKDVIDPLEPYRRQMEEINNLYEQSKLTSEEWSKSLDAVAKKMDGLNADTKKANATAQQFGLTMASSLGRVITNGGTARDVFRALTKDIEQMITQMLILQPMQTAMSGWFKSVLSPSGGSGGGMFGSLMSAIGLGGASNTAFGSTSFASAAAEGVIPMAGGGDFMVNKPTLFLAGEAGPERATFGGANSTGGSAQPVVVQMSFTSLDPRTHAQLMMTPQMQRIVRGIIEQGYAANGTVSGMAAR